MVNLFVKSILCEMCLLSNRAIISQKIFPLAISIIVFLARFISEIHHVLFFGGRYRAGNDLLKTECLNFSKPGGDFAVICMSVCDY